MSWKRDCKGFQKAVNRLPHRILSKKSEVTHDTDFINLEKRFNEFSKVLDRLEKDARAFRDSISALLTHQAAMASFLSIIYDSQLGAQAEEGGVQRRFQQTPASAVQAVNDAEAAMTYCRDEVLPELDSVDRFVIKPTLELKDIIKTIQKTIVKRNHKQIDYDRHRASLNKLKAKEQRSFSEEKQIYKIEQQLETATQDYEYLNDMLKQELPRFFHLKAQFIEPVFNNLYFLQCKIYGMIYARCYELANANTEHFPTLNMPIEDGFNWRKTQRDARAEMENIDLLKSGGKAWLSVSGGQNNSRLTLKERAALRQQENGMMSSPPPPAYGASGGVTLDSTPMNGASKEYGYGAGAGYGAAAGYGGGHQRSTSRTEPSPPPPPPIANKAKTQYVVALYDYDAQADGDLSFKKDDKIEVIERTADQNDWWTGRLRGQTGIFPGNYVAEL